MGDGRSAIGDSERRLAIRDSHQFPIRDSQIPDSRFAISDSRFRAIHDSPFQLAISNQQLAIR
jgi:hypothetical protein